MTIEETKSAAYNSIKNQLEAGLANGCILSIKGLKKVIADLKKRIKAVEFGSAFASSMEELHKAELAIANLSGQKQAYQEKLDWVNEKIKNA